MFRLRGFLTSAAIALTVLCGALFGVAGAQEINPQTGKVLFSAPDLAALRQAVDFVEKSPELLPDVWHYTSAVRDENQFRAAEELAVMDTGLAGPKWKAVYDYVARLDAKLPAGATDRYRARHALAAQIQKLFEK